MQNDTKKKAKEAFKTGKSSTIAQAMLAYYKSINFYRKTYTPPSILQQPIQEDDDIINVAKDIFG
jgi:hypothetical protein